MPPPVPAQSTLITHSPLSTPLRDLPHPAALTPRLIDWAGIQFYAFEENGRLYPPWRQGKYPWPCDIEERDRWNITFGIIHRLILDQHGINGEPDFVHVTAAPSIPITPTRVLDLKCDTGVWCNDMALRFPEAQIVGYGVIEGQTKPRANVQFIVPDHASGHKTQFDYNDPYWLMPAVPYDLIHASQLLGYIDDWMAFYHNCFSLLAVNGYIEHFEIDWEPRSASKLLPQHSPICQWYREIERALARQGRSLSTPKETSYILEEMGFDDITHRTHRIPASAWPFDQKQRNIGEWFHYLIAGQEQDLRLLETLAIGPLTRYLGWRAEDVRKLSQECVKCVRTKEYQIYFTLHIWTARKPQPAFTMMPGSRM